MTKPRHENRNGSLIQEGEEEEEEGLYPEVQSYLERINQRSEVAHFKAQLQQ